MLVPIGAFVVFAASSMLLWFHQQNKATRENHHNLVGKLKKSISLNRSQISVRQHHIDHYDLLRHNLDEALAVQAEIII